MKIAGRFSKIAKTENSIVIGLIGNLTEENIAFKEIIQIAGFYGVNTAPDKFGYHLITAEGAIKRGCAEPTGNYNGFLEIFTHI